MHLYSYVAEILVACVYTCHMNNSILKNAPSWLLSILIITQRVQENNRGGSELPQHLRADKFNKKGRVGFLVQTFLKIFILERADMLPYSSDSVTSEKKVQGRRQWP